MSNSKIVVNGLTLGRDEAIELRNKLIEALNKPTGWYGMFNSDTYCTANLHSPGGTHHLTITYPDTCMFDDNRINHLIAHLNKTGYRP